ncbi:hypothetical protein SAMN05444143_10192 [Flavobacterium succinicans]|jgi:hypothetical protein|uniref:Uncharacterized protein n=1 Tax=Flavobacterium succinicans TaxID=29536 RepID=A0A1I4QWZ1_9FLAO|nr:DUF6327 family protein [Flavobacterium succinicans]SFM44531.1 hypothetical protein SAMN05444143_10192 [Flavobacterium succinicans]
MEAKKYASYAEIERDLEILKLQKEIHYQKVVLSFQKTRESFEPKNIINSYLGSFKETLSNNYVQLLQAAIPYILGWIINKKRGL